jgi:hypothetical protein
MPAMLPTQLKMEPARPTASFGAVSVTTAHVPAPAASDPRRSLFRAEDVGKLLKRRARG